MSPFLDHVVNIVALSSYKKMIWANTWRIVAFVQNIKSWRYF
jgi:hypothetical protein